MKSLSKTGEKLCRAAAVIVAACVAFGGASSPAAIVEWFSVVIVTDNFNESAYQVLTNDEYTALTKELWNRNRVLTQAIRMARDEWTKADETKDKVYPVSVTCKAEVNRLKTFPARDQAEAYVKELQDKDAAKAEKEKPKTYLEQRIETLQFELDNPPAVYPIDRGRWVAVRKEEISAMSAELAERRAKDGELEALAAKAKELIKGFIEQLIAAQPKDVPQIMM